MKPKYIIFDLGGVIIDIDFEQTYRAFGKLSGKSNEELHQATFLTKAYEQYESGLITDTEFRNELRTRLALTCSDNEIEAAWNALLLDFNLQALIEIQKLKGQFPMYLLSNTNRIHFNYCNQKLKNQLAGVDFYQLFDQLFLSYEMGHRKPSMEIYKQVVDKLLCNPDEILFIDDLAANINAAKSIGFQTIHLVDNQKIRKELQQMLR